MQDKNESKIVKHICGEACSACGACQRSKKKDMLAEVRRIGNAVLNEETLVRSLESMTSLKDQ